MKEFFLELFSEEIPYKLQDLAKEQTVALFKKFLENVVDFENVECHITPSRIVLHCFISEFTNAIAIKKRGPQKTANEKAISGFLKANSAKIEDCFLETVSGKEYWFFNQQIPARNTKDILKDLVKYILENFKWPKVMRWSSEIKWIRPLRNIFVMFDSEFQKCDLFGVPSENLIKSHKLIGSPFVPSSYEDYKKKLAENFVILEQKERKNKIINEFNVLECANNFKILKDEDLVEEVIGITEFPKLFVSNFGEEFLSLPHEILINFMICSLKVFPVLDKNERLTNYFVGASNIAETRNAKIGSAKLIKAKLCDAKFFFDRDVATPIRSLENQIKNINFYNGLGSIYDKSIRISKVVDVIVKNCEEFKSLKIEKLREIASLMKCDLASSMVFEYPELHGIVGAYMAEFQGFDQDIVKAIKCQYMPENANEKVPTNKYAIVISLADKIESLVSFFNLGISVNSSKDPLGMRRFANGITRIIIENRLNLHIADVIKLSFGILGAEKNLDACIKFVFERLNNLIGCNQTIINAVVASHGDCSLFEIKTIAENFGEFFETTHGKNLVAIAKRFSNFALNVDDFDFKDINSDLNKMLDIFGVNPDLFESDYERQFASCVEKMISEMSCFNGKSRDAENFAKILMNNAELLSCSGENLFANVMINSDDEKLKNNRINLITAADFILNKFLKISLLF